MKSEFIKAWDNCTFCPLHKNARHHVIMRGSIPARILFIGEAPGKVEDKLGRPFVGRSGSLLNYMLQSLGITDDYCITNIICCIPWNYDHKSIRKPNRTEADACLPHVHELLQLCQPLLVVTLGAETARYLPAKSLSHYGANYLNLRHPAYILRQGGIASLEYKRAHRKLHTALTEVGLLNPNSDQANPVQYVKAN